MKRTIQFLFAVSAFCFIAAACNALSPADKASIAADTVYIALCQAETKQCKDESGDGGTSKCWGVYDACMAAHGLKDAGSQ